MFSGAAKAADIVTEKPSEKLQVLSYHMAHLVMYDKDALCLVVRLR
ncbi:hypothetical protein ES703_61406 [subsurface metagenome]